MTDTTTEPVVAPEAAPGAPPDPPPTPQTAEGTQAAAELAHTAGGYPVMPLALSSANTTVSLVGAAGVVGGPVGAAAAAGGAVLLGTVAALVRARRLAAEHRRTDSRTPSNSRTGRGGADRRSGRGVPGQGRGSRAGGSAGRGAGGRRASGNSRTGSRSSGIGAGLRSAAGRGGASLRKTGNSPSGAGRGRSGAERAGRSGSGRVAQARGLRAANRQQNPTRSAARAQGRQDRRAVADARRDARSAARQARQNTAGGRGRMGRAAAWGGRKAASGARALTDRARARRDRAIDTALSGKRDGVRKAPARRKARWALWRSAARMFGKRLLAGALGGAVGLVGCLTTPLGRKFGIPALMHPGRRLYRRLVAKAREQRAERDAQIRATRGAEEAHADADARGECEIGDRVERPAHLIPVSYPTPSEVENVSGFKFEEAAAEMQNAAATYDPDNNMEVVDMIDNLPAALECVAKTFLILAERSDQEFAFEKQVADGFDDIYKSLLNAVDAAVDLGPQFREIHEADIARHEDPRNGADAEKKWNV